jgi:broad specificity phosphatase PhoE
MIRHGIAHHNVVESERDRDSRDLFDPSLTTRGRSSTRQSAIFMTELLTEEKAYQQTTIDGGSTKSESNSSACGSACKASSKEALNNVTPKNVTIISSPLTRCLETSMILHNEISKRAPETVIMRQLYCHESLREAYGIYLSDQRRNKSQLKAQFPCFQFDVQMTEEDELWTCSDRETVASIDERIRKFFRDLASSYTTEIAPSDPKEKEAEAVVILVTHGVWMECCLNHYTAYLMQGGKRVHNGDIYRAELKLDERPPCRIQLHNVQFVSSGVL